MTVSDRQATRMNPSDTDVAVYLLDQLESQLEFMAEEDLRKTLAHCSYMRVRDDEAGIVPNYWKYMAKACKAQLKALLARKDEP